jgi:hypothetical protein
MKKRRVMKAPSPKEIALLQEIFKRGAPAKWQRTLPMSELVRLGNLAYRLGLFVG